MTFQLTLRNFSAEPLQAVTLTDRMAGGAPAFGSPATGTLLPGTYRVISTGGTCGGLNPAYDGSGDTRLVLGLTLAPDAACTATLTLQVRPTAPFPPEISPGVRYANQGTLTGTGQWTGQSPATNPLLSDLSTDGPDPDPNGNGQAGDPGEDVPTPVTVGSIPGIALVKTADTSGLSSPTQPGDPIIWRFAVTNTGNVPLTNVTVSDPFPGVTLTGAPISLAPGQTDATSFTGRSVIVEQDFDAERVVNQATATGTPPAGPPVTDLSGATLTDDAPTVVPISFQAVVTATKTADADRVILGDSLGYTLGFTSTAPGTLRDATVVDVLPPGLVYTPGSARVGGVAQEPLVTGRTLRWAGLTLARNVPLTITLRVRVTGSAPWGKLENRTWIEADTGAPVSNTAVATVLREPEHVFDCADIIGKVFDDVNANGHQDAPEAGAQDAAEPGLPDVRLLTTRGIVVTTDAFGRFHVPCAELPRSMGSNVTMKLDTASLPSGYRLTTENPRTIRVTPGKMAKLNFGAALSRVVRIDLTGQAFGADGEPSAALVQAVAGLVGQLDGGSTVLRLNYQLGPEPKAEARSRLTRVETLIRDTWDGDRGRLTVEQTLQLPTDGN